VRTIHLFTWVEGKGVDSHEGEGKNLLTRKKVERKKYRQRPLEKWENGEIVFETTEPGRPRPDSATEWQEKPRKRPPVKPRNTSCTGEDRQKGNGDVQGPQRQGGGGD